MEHACERTASLGFPAIEIFPPAPEAIAAEKVRPLLERRNLKAAAIGTGAGWVIHRWSLTDRDPEIRRQAIVFILGIIEAAAALGAPAVIGSMQGRTDGETGREQGIQWLADGLRELSARSADLGAVLLYEPLNRYETNLFHRLGDTVEFLHAHALKNVRILGDLFHMAIEEASLPEAIRSAGALLGHVHFADSNRQAIGFGHTDVGPVINALQEIGYAGYLSAEILPLPDAETAARQTLASARRFVP